MLFALQYLVVTPKLTPTDSFSLVQVSRRMRYAPLADLASLGTLLNAEIIRQGYGYALTRFPFSRLEEFRRLEREARDRRRGLWADNP